MDIMVKDKDEFNKELGERVKKRRDILGLSQQELADLIGLTSRTSISKIEQGANGVSQKTVDALAQALQTTPDYIMGWDDNPIFSTRDIFETEIRTLPVLGQIACGQPIFANEDIEYVSIKDAPKNADFILIAKGDSMINAKINDEDYVFIKKQPTVRNGEIAAVIIDDEATLKRVYFDAENQTLTLVAENPAYAPMVYVGEQLEHVKILGKAIALQTEIR